jgi:type 1 fimbria pilin
MNKLFTNRITLCALATLALFVCASRADATVISGHISTTVTITEDSQLVGDVTCAVPLTASGANPCIAFGADHINLRLNGHTIMGPVDAPIEPNNCSFPTDSMFGVGILANGRTDVISILPGDRRTATFRRQSVQRQLVCLLTE